MVIDVQHNRERVVIRCCCWHLLCYPQTLRLRRLLYLCLMKNILDLKKYLKGIICGPGGAACSSSAWKESKNINRLKQKLIVDLLVVEVINSWRKFCLRWIWWSDSNQQVNQQQNIHTLMYEWTKWAACTLVEGVGVSRTSAPAHKYRKREREKAKTAGSFMLIYKQIYLKDLLFL